MGPLNLFFVPTSYVSYAFRTGLRFKDAYLLAELRKVRTARVYLLKGHIR